MKIHLSSMRKNPKFINKKGHSSASFFDKLALVIKVIRIELLITLLALIVSLGQYFQNSINVRINITRTWREGYTSENRDRVNRFIYSWNKWKSECLEKEGDNCEEKIKETIDIFASNENLFGGPIKNNSFIKDLVENEINAIQRKENLDKTTPNTNPAQNSPREITNNDYIEIVLKYRNAIIESLNTMEAVKAVIQSKPLPFKVNIFYKDTLEGRYRDIIEELKEKLMDFIVAYREAHPNRETEAWYVLTSDESYLNDFVNVVLYFLVFSAVLTSVYLVKIQIQNLGSLEGNAK